MRGKLKEGEGWQLVLGLRVWIEWDGEDEKCRR